MTYETEAGERYRVSFVPRSETQWLRIEEEAVDGGEWRYTGSAVVTDVNVTGSVIDDESVGEV